MSAHIRHGINVGPKTEIYASCWNTEDGKVASVFKVNMYDKFGAFDYQGDITPAQLRELASALLEHADCVDELTAQSAAENLTEKEAA